MACQALEEYNSLSTAQSTNGTYRVTQNRWNYLPKQSTYWWQLSTMAKTI